MLMTGTWSCDPDLWLCAMHNGGYIMHCWCKELNIPVKLFDVLFQGWALWLFFIFKAISRMKILMSALIHSISSFQS